MVAFANVATAAAVGGGWGVGKGLPVGKEVADNCCSHGWEEEQNA